jgi:hypothetical protein
MTTTVVTTVVWIVNKCVVLDRILKVESLGCHITEMVFVETSVTRRIELYLGVVHETPFFHDLASYFVVNTNSRMSLFNRGA